tara:strand:- start:3497 stop:7033 length:3537 start_codon:yes stop_codon:yes gene_type:complete
MSTTPERESRTLHQKKPQIDRVHEGYPPKNSGYEGEIRLHFIKGDGLRLYVRRAKEWHYTSLSTTGTTSTSTTVSSGGGSGDITSVTAGTGLSGGGTTGAVTLNVSGLTVSELAANSLQTSGESFSDNDTSLMTSAAIQDKIQSFSYITLSSLSASTPITYNNGTGAFSVTDNAITVSKIQQVATDTFLGRDSSGTGNIEVLSLDDVEAMLQLNSYLQSASTNSLTDMTTSTPSAGHYLRHNGVNFVNTAFVVSDITGLLASQIPALATSKITSGTFADARISQSSVTQHASAVKSTASLMSNFVVTETDTSTSNIGEGTYIKFAAANSGSYGNSTVTGAGTSGDPYIVQVNAPDTNTTYSVMGSGNSYAAGLVLAGASSHGNTYLRKDGTWTLPSIHIQDDDGDSLTVDIDEHIKITGTGGITTDWTTDDAGGSGAPNILTIGLGSITQVGALSQGSIASGFTTIDEGFIDSDIVRKNANTTITGIYTFSGKGIAINAGTANDASGYDASLYISASQDNDWGIWIDKTTLNYGIKVDVAADASAAFGVYNDSTNRFMISGSGVVTTGTWNGTVIASAYLDADTAHLSGTQTFSGAKTFSSTTTFSNTSSYGDLDIIPTSSNVSIIKHDNGSGSLTLRGDQIRLQNKDGDDTGLTYNDAGGVTFAGDVNVTADGARFFVSSADYELVSIGRAGSSGSALDQGYFRMKSAGSNKVAFHTAGDSYINGGSLGVGTASPENDVSGLHVSVASSTDQLYLERTGSGTGRYYLGTSNNSLFIVDDAQSATRLTIDSSGNTTFAGDVNLATTKTLFFDGASGHTFISEFSANKMQLQAGGQGSVILDGTNSGEIRIGVGTSSPAGKIHAKVTTNTSETIRIQNDDSLTTIGVSSDGYSFHTYQHSLYWASWDGSTWSTKARLDNDGNWGIGDTSPSTALTSFGSASRGLSIKNVQPTIALTDTDTGSGHFWISNAGGITYFQNNVSGSTYRFYTAAGEAIRIKSNNNVAIGGTGGYQKLSVEGGHIYMSTGYQITWSNGNASIANSGYELRFSTYSGSSVIERMRIESDGDVHCDADVIAYSNTIGSDKRLKKNIADIKYGLDDVLKLRGVEFDWNRKDYAKKHDVGFIAQEVREVIPELVKRTSGLNDKGSFLTVDYAKLVPVLVESIKDLKKEIEDLKNGSN